MVAGFLQVVLPQDVLKIPKLKALAVLCLRGMTVPPPSLIPAPSPTAGSNSCPTSLVALGLRRAVLMLHGA